MSAWSSSAGRGRRCRSKTIKLPLLQAPLRWKALAVSLMWSFGSAIHPHCVKSNLLRRKIIGIKLSAGKRRVPYWPHDYSQKPKRASRPINHFGVVLWHSRIPGCRLNQIRLKEQLKEGEMAPFSSHLPPPPVFSLRLATSPALVSPQGQTAHASEYKTHLRRQAH